VKLIYEEKIVFSDDKNKVNFSVYRPLQILQVLSIRSGGGVINGEKEKKKWSKEC
jgi:hypothetical protein